jgi:transposase-like protein
MTRRNFNSEFKKKVAIEAIREQRTINEIAASYEVHPVQIRKWKKELLDGAITIFENPNKQKNRHVVQDEQTSRLEQKIGQLTVENDWLKKKLGS